MKNFFHMPRGDLLFLAALMAVSVVSFLPWARSTQWAGMSMLGWMMALLMVLSPLIALLRILAQRRKSGTLREEPKE